MCRVDDNGVVGLEKLAALIEPLPAALVAYSGGADSAFLADVAHEILGPRMAAVTAVSASLHPAERSAAASLARERGWAHEEISTEEVGRPEYARNAPDRCYHCKTTLFEALGALALERGAAVLVGTNLDDAGEHRPGMVAAAEHRVRAPLLEAGLRKAEIRALSRERGLPTWNKPAQACLASRIAYGTEVTDARLQRIARAESFLRDLGFIGDVRVRDHGDLARIEVAPDQVARISDPEVSARAAAFLRGQGFDHVTVDLEGFRSGSMNAPLRREHLMQIGRTR